LTGAIFDMACAEEGKEHEAREYAEEDGGGVGPLGTRAGISVHGVLLGWRV
jgi:hypothetical protein